MDEGLAASVAPGTEAMVRIRGRSEPIAGRVVRVRGAAVESTETRLAARPTGDAVGRLSVAVELPEAAFAGTDAGRYCHLGVPAEVRFPRRLPAAVRVAVTSIQALADLGSAAGQAAADLGEALSRALEAQAARS